MTNLIGAADWPRTNRAVHRLILGSRLVEKIAYVTVSIAWAIRPNLLFRGSKARGPRLGLVSSFPKPMTGALHVSKTAGRADPCARLTIGLLRLGTGRAALPGAAGRDGHRRAGGRRSGGYGRYSDDTGRAGLPGAAGRDGRRCAGARRTGGYGRYSDDSGQHRCRLQRRRHRADRGDGAAAGCRSGSSRSAPSPVEHRLTGSVAVRLAVETGIHAGIALGRACRTAYIACSAACRDGEAVSCWPAR